MCGRLACGLEPQEICKCCYYKQPGSNHYTTPQWKDCHNLGKTYKPSYNICPTDVAPVLLSGKHFQLSSRLVVPMMFGVIPNWAKTSSTKYSTLNCRIETIFTSKLYGNLLQKNQRCAVICSGFYEWQKNHKKPYFIHGEQPDGVKVDDSKTWNLKFSSEKGCSGFRPLRLAALFEISSKELLENETLSFTIITKEASSEISWLHRRMPATLETDEQLDAWLNYEEVDAYHALKFICHKDNLYCFPVSNLVNSSANKDVSCIQQQKDLMGDDKNKKDSVNLLKSWLGRGQKRKNNEVSGGISEKIKKEEK